ncbi:MAG TPA: hypothetical protein VKB51_03455 [bacterium]|nr:hypothetical protein [bacterium]
MPTSRGTRRLVQHAFRLLSGHDHPASFVANTPAHLVRLLGWIDDRVPPRAKRERRHQDHMEWYCLRGYLLALAASGQVAYPLTVRKSQSPDFLLEGPDGAVTGVEVTEATTEAFQRELSATEGQSGPHPIGPPEGWAGNEVERGLAAVVMERIATKAAKISGPHWQPATRHDLLLYHNGPWIGPDLGHVHTMVRDAIHAHPDLRDGAGEWPNGALGRVSILSGDTLLYDVGGAGVPLPLGLGER